MCGSGTGVEHLPQHPQVKGSSPTAAAGTGRGKDKRVIKSFVRLAPFCSSGTGEEHLPQHSKVKGLSPTAAAGIGREKDRRVLKSFVRLSKSLSLYFWN